MITPEQLRQQLALAIAGASSVAQAKADVYREAQALATEFAPVSGAFAAFITNPESVINGMTFGQYLTNDQRLSSHQAMALWAISALSSNDVPGSREMLDYVNRWRALNDKLRALADAPSAPGVEGLA